MMVESTAKVYKEINIQNMDVELGAQMWKNYQSNVLFHLEGSDIDFKLLFDNLLIMNFSD